MLTNTDCTLYQASGIGYERVYIPAVFWMESRGAALMKGANVEDVGITVYIPEEYADSAPKTPMKDMIVKGECKFVFDNTSEKTVSEGMRDLRYHSPAVVKAVDNKLYGTALRHIKVTAV